MHLILRITHPKNPQIPAFLPRMSGVLKLGQELPVGPQTPPFRDTRDVAAGPWRGEARRCVVNAQMRGRRVSLRGDVGVG